jgi:predicted dienelactone hydrolase
MYVCKLFGAIMLCLTATLAQGAGIRAINTPGVIVDPISVFFTDKSFGEVKIPVQLWASEFGGNGVVPDSVDIVDKNLPAKHEYHVVANSGHFAFLAPCPPALVAELPYICKDAGDFDRAAFHRQFNADALAFFKAQLVSAPR